jgi:hypothetical protein
MDECYWLPEGPLPPPPPRHIEQDSLLISLSLSIVSLACQTAISLPHPPLSLYQWEDGKTKDLRNACVRAARV